MIIMTVLVITMVIMRIMKIVTNKKEYDNEKEDSRRLGKTERWNHDKRRKKDELTK